MQRTFSRRKFLFTAATIPFVANKAAAQMLQPSGGDQTVALQLAIAEAGKTGGVVELGPGKFETSVLTIKNNVTLRGIPGATQLHAINGGKVFSIRTAKSVVIQGVGMSTKGTKGNLLTAEGIERLIVENCDFSGGEAGVRIASCGGHVVGSRFRFHQQVGCFAIDNTMFKISGNTLSDIGNNGIQVWRSNAGDDGTIVTDNHVSRIASEDGGDGQNGNAINVYLAGGVIVSNNRLSDCAFSGIRNNAGSNIVISGNGISRCNEVALYVEFGFQGAVVANNVIDTAAHGISMTNFNEGGRLALCTGNVLRNLKGNNAHGQPLGGGISSEADTIISNNIVEDADVYGIGLGWGSYGRNLTASGNLLRNCGRGIVFSMAGEGPYNVSQNTVVAARSGAVTGMDHDKPVTSDLSLADAVLPKTLNLSGNLVKN